MRLLFAALAAASALFTYPLTSAADGPKRVRVTNFPDPQNVTGSVEVTNFPLVQEVAGVVEVTKLAGAGEAQLVGYTSTPVLAGDGPLSMARACAAQFSESHLCTTEEIIATSNPPELAGALVAWVRPLLTFDALVNETNDKVEVLTTETVTGRTLRRNDTQAEGFTCASYNPGGGGDHWVITASGHFTLASCGSAFPVACCAPVP